MPSQGLINAVFFLKQQASFSGFETSQMIVISSIALLDCLITVSHFLKTMERASNETAAISLETNEIETFNCNIFQCCILFSEKPTVTMSSKPHPSPIEGERLTLTCRANEDTKEIRWTKDGVPVNSRANISRIGNNSTLVIENVLTSDSGKYSCMAVNKAGSASSSVDIRVTGNKDG